MSPSHQSHFGTYKIVTIIRITYLKLVLMHIIFHCMLLSVSEAKLQETYCMLQTVLSLSALDSRKKWMLKTSQLMLLLSTSTEYDTTEKLEAFLTGDGTMFQ